MHHILDSAVHADVVLERYKEELMATMIKFVHQLKIGHLQFVVSHLHRTNRALKEI